MVLRKSKIHPVSARVTIFWTTNISHGITCRPWPTKASAPIGAGNAGEALAGLGPLLAQEDGLISQPVLSIPNTI